MATKKLGKGLSSLLENQHASDNQERGGALWVNTEALQQSTEQPRKDLDRGISQLADSLRRHGMMQPILVTELGEGKYEILAGERRWRAASLAGMRQVPVLLRPQPSSAAERLELALIENIQREDLDAIERAKACQRLLTEYGLTQEQVAEKLGYERPTVANLVRLLELPTAIQENVSRGTMTAGHGRALLRLNGTAAQARAAKDILDQGLSVRAAESLCGKLSKGAVAPSHKPRPAKPAWLSELQEQFTRQFGVKSELRLHARGGGKLVFHFQDLDSLESLSQAMGLQGEEAEELLRG